MTEKNRKVRQIFTPKQKNELSKLIVEDNHSIKHVMGISGASHSAVTIWKSQYLNEKDGNLSEGKVPLNEDKREIYGLKRQLAEAREDIRILKKANSLIHTRQSSIALIKRVSKAEPNLSIERVCSLLEVPVSSFYFISAINQENKFITKK